MSGEGEVRREPDADGVGAFCEVVARGVHELKKDSIDARLAPVRTGGQQASIVRSSLDDDGTYRVAFMAGDPDRLGRDDFVRWVADACAVPEDQVWVENFVAVQAMDDD